MEPKKVDVQNIIRDHFQRDDYTGWFEDLYTTADRNAGDVPWAYQTANPYLLEWFNAHELVGEGQRALVIGCGLGDDAEFLAQVGYEVVAFDIAPSAIAWCKRRFPNSTVDYIVADLFNPPMLWKAAFDFVLESRTIQSLPLKMRMETIGQVADFVAPGGTLLVICMGREDDEDPGSMPWPLSRAELRQFDELGLVQISFETLVDSTITPAQRFRVTYRNANTRS